VKTTYTIKKTVRIEPIPFWKIFIVIYVGHVVYWLFCHIQILNCTKVNSNMSIYFDFYLLTDHVHLDAHTVTLSTKYKHVGVILHMMCLVYTAYCGNMWVFYPKQPIWWHRRLYCQNKYRNTLSWNSKSKYHVCLFCVLSFINERFCDKIE
jgi:hypothetical protein